MKIGQVQISNSPAIMGIVNATPDSFSDGGLFLDCEEGIKQALRLAQDGADIVDIGGESARPGSMPVALDEELKRVIPIIKGIRRHSNVAISIDTTKSEVAAEAIAAGANMINDISAGRFDPDLLSVAAQSGASVCLMHMKGTPTDMQLDTGYVDVISDIADFLNEAAGRALAKGVRPDQIFLDPGIGFGKSAGDNVLILQNLNRFIEIGFPLLIGASRKSFIGKLLGYNVKERLEATLATIPACIEANVSILRLHDVLESRRFIEMFKIVGS